MGALGSLLDLKIEYYATVNLGASSRSSTPSAASTSTSPGASATRLHDEYGFSNGFSITAGRHHLNGNQALAYARVRKAAGESDFTRAARQQEVVSGIRDAIVRGGFINDPIGLHQGDRQDGRRRTCPRKAAARPGRARQRDRPRRRRTGP